MIRDALRWGIAAAICLLAARSADAAPPLVRFTSAQARFTSALARFDFTRPAGREGWHPTHDVGALSGTSEGMVIAIGGPDPYLIGPPRDLPAGQPLWLRLRLRSDQGGMGQVFYFREDSGPTEENSVRFAARAGAWTEVRLPLPPLGPGTRFRIDPPGTTGGVTTLTFLSLEPRTALPMPDWPRPEPPAIAGDTALSLTSGDLTLVHAGNQLGGFVLDVAGPAMATGHTRPLIGYTRGDRLRWLDLAEHARVRVAKQKNTLAVRADFRDGDGADWEIRQRFAPGVSGAIEVETRVSVSAERTVVFLPLLLVLPGAGLPDSFGAEKTQGLFAGLEYLDNEPGSSEADLIGPAARRQVPDTAKITFPLMAVAARDRYVGLIWEKNPRTCALFDSPDRLLGGGGHAMGLLFPGSDGGNREEGSLLPYEGERLAANQPLVQRATILGGRGKGVVPVIQKYVALRGLPPVPSVGSAADAYALLASGWLDSGIREGNLFRHAAAPGFGAQPAADAAFWMDWLAARVPDPEQARRLREAATGALAAVGPGEVGGSGVSHVRPPVAPLVYGHVAENVERARAAGRELLHRFEPDGRVLYRRDPARPDFGRTHFAPDANGLAAPLVAALLEAAALSGDADLRREGIRVLHALDRFDNTVPRGAQTWEVPLHTPDILASAHLVRAYTLGYELTGEKAFRERALYWAWTGVPFVYLVNPTSQSVGPYATIAVLGATNWVAPIWIGLPVQWCGLVYADALYRLARHDPKGPWRRLAEGITASGIQQTWPRSQKDRERQGLLPDSFAPAPQIRNDPAINPGTVEANAVRLLDRSEIYDFRALPASGLLLHAPGALESIRDAPGRIAFRVHGWPDHPYFVLIAGLKATGMPRVRINGRETALASASIYQASQGRLILPIQGRPTVEVDWNR